MARPAKYTTPEEKRQANAVRQAALRERSARVKKASLESLLAAVEAAAAAGDELAEEIRTGTPDSLLRNLAHHFRTRAAELRQQPAASAAKRGQSSTSREKPA